MKALKPWKTLSSKVILSHDLLKVTEDTVRLPNGKRSTYVRHAPTDVHSVAVVAVNSQGEVLIQREYSYPPNMVMWQLPGGSMKPGETIAEAATRELAEESGYSARSTTLLGSFYVHNRLSDMKQYIVLCTDLYEMKLQEDDDEFIETYWKTKKQLSEMIRKSEFENINLLAGLNLWFHSN